MKTALIIPTLNAEPLWEQVLTAIDIQTFQPDIKILLDSGSMDRTIEMASKNGFETHTIQPQKFNHGLTRQYGAELASEAEILIYMTQDAVLEGEKSLELLASGLRDPAIAATYGRQIPRPYANASERIMREFNYQETSRLKTKNDIPELGIHAAFCSNSFAAYRKADLLEVGGFPEADFGEDMLLAAQLILSGKTIYYNAASTIIHSHSDTLKSSFKRGRAIGKMHRQHPWLIEHFSSPRKHISGIIIHYLSSLQTYRVLPALQLVLHGSFKYLGYTIEAKVK